MPEGPESDAAPTAVGDSLPPALGVVAAVAGADEPTGDIGIAVALDQFSGPMDLLLYLVRRLEVDVRELPITAIADQFATWVASAEELDLEQAGDFVVMAATLLEIKARMVAPPPAGTAVVDDGEDDYDPRAGLIRRLLVYRAAKEAAFDLDRRDGERRLRHERGHREVVPDDPEELDAWELKDVDVGALATLWYELLKRLDGLGPRTVIVDDLPLGVRMAQLAESLRLRGECHLSEFFALEPGKIGRVGLVMAVLESTRQRFLQLRQGEQYGDVLLRFRPEAERALASGDPGPPEQLPKRQRRPPLVTWSPADGSTAEAGEAEAGEEPPPENEEQRFLRELEQGIGVERLLSRSADLEVGFITWWEETHPGEPLPQGVVKPVPPPAPEPSPPEPVPLLVAAAAEPPRPKRQPPRPRPADEAPPAAAAAAAPEIPAGPLPEVVAAVTIPDPAPEAPPSPRPLPSPPANTAIPDPPPAAAQVADPAAGMPPGLPDPAAGVVRNLPVPLPVPVAAAIPDPEPLLPAGLVDLRDPEPTFIVEPLEDAPATSENAVSDVAWASPPMPVDSSDPGQDAPATSDIPPDAVSDVAWASPPMSMESSDPGQDAPAASEDAVSDVAWASPPMPAESSDHGQDAPAASEDAVSDVAWASPPMSMESSDPGQDAPAASDIPPMPAESSDPGQDARATAEPGPQVASARDPVPPPGPPPDPEPPPGPPPAGSTSQTAPPTTTPILPSPTSRPMSRPNHTMLAALIALIALNVLIVVGFIVWFYRPADVLALAEGPDGAVVSRDGEVAWTLNLPLEDLAKAPLPQVAPAGLGTCAWRDARTVVFTPTGSLPAEATISINFPPELRAAGSFRFPKDAAPVRSLRTLPALSATAASSQAPAFGETSIVLALNRQPVDPTALFEAISLVPKVSFQAVCDADGLRLTGDFVPGSTYRIALAATGSGRPDDQPAAWSAEVAVPQRTPGVRLQPGVRPLAMIEAVGIDLLVVASGRNREVLRPLPDGAGVARAAVPAWLLASGSGSLAVSWAGGSAILAVDQHQLRFDPVDLVPLLTGGTLPVVSVR